MASLSLSRRTAKGLNAHLHAALRHSLPDFSETPDRVWYACYGSNLDPARFATYLAGGTPPGSKIQNAGARDNTPAARSLPARIGHRLLFSRYSSGWGGAPAFLDPTPSDTFVTLGRMHDITWEQFEDVLAQENGRAPGSLSLSWSEIEESGGKLDLKIGWYGTVLCLGEHEGRPILTITTSDPETLSMSGVPSAAYVERIAVGLLDTYPGITAQEIIDYLVGAAVPEAVVAIREGVELAARHLRTD